MNAAIKFFCRQFVLIIASQEGSRQWRVSSQLKQYELTRKWPHSFPPPPSVPVIIACINLCRSFCLIYGDTERQRKKTDDHPC